MSNLNKSLSIFLSILAAAFFLVSPALAQGRGETMRTQAATRAAERSCEARQGAVTTRMNHLVRLSNNMVGVFDSISARVQAYYTDTVLPTGATLANYNELVADIESKKDAVDTAINEAQIDVNSFSCLGDVRALYNEFRADMFTVKASLKEYRTSIKNLIVAVHTAVPDEDESEANGEE